MRGRQIVKHDNSEFSCSVLNVAMLLVVTCELLMSAGDSDSVAKTETGNLTLKLETSGNIKNIITVKAQRRMFTT